MGETEPKTNLGITNNTKIEKIPKPVTTLVFRVLRLLWIIEIWDEGH